MYYRYQPYPYYRRPYNINPYYRYYNPYNPYNIYNSQISDVNQNITNFGDMTDVIQNANVFQSMAEPVGMCTSPMVSPQESIPQESIPEDPAISAAVPFPI
jgi:hypothetical protein